MSNETAHSVNQCNFNTVKKEEAKKFSESSRSFPIRQKQEINFQGTGNQPADNYRMVIA
jgi:hypothetical protein